MREISSKPLGRPEAAQREGHVSGVHLFAGMSRAWRFAESGRGLPQSKTLRVRRNHRILRQLLECASPLALSFRDAQPLGDTTPGKYRLPAKQNGGGARNT